MKIWFAKTIEYKMGIALVRPVYSNFKIATIRERHAISRLVVALDLYVIMCHYSHDFWCLEVVPDVIFPF